MRQTNLLIVLISMLYSLSIIAQNQTPQLYLQPQNVTLEVGGEVQQFSDATDASKMVSSQYQAGNPRDGYGADLSQCCYTHIGSTNGNAAYYDNFWLSGWEDNPVVPDYPHTAYIDLVDFHEVTDIYVYDMEGLGEINIYAGEPGDWSDSPIANFQLDSFHIWKGVPINNEVTRYLRIERMDETSNFAEVVVYGNNIPTTYGWQFIGPHTVYSAGNDIGINTNNPTEALDVIGNIKASGGVDAGDDITTSKNIIVGENISSNGDMSVGGSISASTISTTELEVNDNIEANTISATTISANTFEVGQIDINTINITNKLNIATTESTPSSYKLAVGGFVIAEEVTVRLQEDWPDYVFDDDYYLTPLDEVEKQIKEKGHLHNSKSAEEIEAGEGVHLKDVAIDQQEKIEELFLHLIELQERILLLEKENNQLQKASYELIKK